MRQIEVTYDVPYAKIRVLNKGGIQMQHLLYYKDSFIKQFTADVLHTGTDEIGYYVVLSNTAFYPTGGGQPHDTGTIANIEVINVENINNEIRHYLNTPVELCGEVEGIINWNRRFDHMQQHAGQHILTAAFVELFGYDTVSFHLGSTYVSIDLNTEKITEDQLRLVELRANEIIMEARPIKTKFVTKEELTKYNLRKEIQAEENIRLVIIPDYDYNGCGGTHPISTAQVQMIKILNTEIMRSNIRIHFICGQRVLNGFAKQKNVLSTVAKKLSVPELEVDKALEKFAANAAKVEKELAKAKEALLEFESVELAKQSLAMKTFENRSIQELQKLARLIVTKNPNTIALLIATNDDKLQFVAARGANINVSMKSIAADILPLINGKGGGNEQFVQGGGETLMTAENLLEQMHAKL